MSPYRSIFPSIKRFDLQGSNKLQVTKITTPWISLKLGEALVAICGHQARYNKLSAGIKP